MLGVCGACRQPTAVSSCHPRCACLSSVPDQVPRWAVQIAVKETGFFNPLHGIPSFPPQTQTYTLCGTTQLLLWKSWLSCGIKMVQR